MEQQPPVLEVRRVTKPPALAGVTPTSSVLRRDGPPVDVLQRLAACLVGSRVRPVAARAVHANAAPRAGCPRFACRTINGQPVTIASLEHRPMADQGGERSVERSHRDAGGRLDVGVGERRQRRTPEHLDDLLSVAHGYPLA